MDLTERLKIPIDGDNQTEFYTKSGTLVAKGYERVVLGGRGAYVEFGINQINLGNMHIPKGQEYRTTSKVVYYVEYRSNDASNVKYYYQKKTVDYADYKLNKWYVSPFDLVVNGLPIIEKINIKKAEEEPTLDI